MSETRVVWTRDTRPHDPSSIGAQRDRALASAAVGRAEDRVSGTVPSHVRKHRGPLAVTYGAAVIENTFELLDAFAIGLAVNGLLDGSWGGVLGTSAPHGSTRR